MESINDLRPAERSSTTTKCPSLPAEIWLLIFSVGEFDEHGRFWSSYDHPTMASICRCCTLFCDLVRPRLYYNFESDYFASCRCFSVARFAWSIATNPRLASMVRYATIRRICNMFPLYWPSVTATDDHGHPMASVLINKAAELGVDFKYYEVYTNKHGCCVGFDLVALVLAQLPAMITLDLTWFESYEPARMPEPCGGWPWSQSRKEFFTYLSFSSCGLRVRELKIFLTPVDNQTWKVNQPHSSRDGLEALLHLRHHPSRGASCLSPFLLEPRLASPFRCEKAGKAFVVWQLCATSALSIRQLVGPQSPRLSIHRARSSQSRPTLQTSSEIRLHRLGHREPARPVPRASAEQPRGPGY